MKIENGIIGQLSNTDLELSDIDNKKMATFFDDMFAEAEASNENKQFAILVPMTGRVGGGSIMWHRKKRFRKKREKFNRILLAKWYADHGLADYMIDRETP